MIIPPHSAAIQTARFEDNVATREHKIEHKNKNRKIASAKVLGQKHVRRVSGMARLVRVEHNEQEGERFYERRGKK